MNLWQGKAFVQVIFIVALYLSGIAPTAQGAYPADPTADISWSANFDGVADIQAAFNTARTAENAQLGTSLPLLTLPAQATWDAMSEGEKALWLINRERGDRGVEPLHGVETNVTQVAQDYAEYLLANDATGHTADGHDPWWRLEQNSAIDTCHDFLNVAENLFYIWATADIISLSTEYAVYLWMYDDSGSSWGHRHAILWYPYNDNSGPSGREGFLGIGTASGSHQDWPYAEIVVMNVFDPCPSWDYPQPLSTLYVDGVSGSDSVGDGSQSQPYQTVGKAVQEASAGNTIVLQAGSYDETMTITKQVRIESQDGVVRIGE